jgi:hypothetical protein
MFLSNPQVLYQPNGQLVDMLLNYPRATPKYAILVQAF